MAAVPLCDLTSLLDDARPLFRRAEPHRVLTSYVNALLSDLPRKNSWSIAGHAGYRTARPFEHLLNGSVWDCSALRDLIRDHVAARAGDAGDPGDGLAVVHDLPIVKRGNRSVGVDRQWSDTHRRTENVQLVPMLAYTVGGRFAYLDRELYLPRSWADDVSRRAAQGVPSERGYASRPELAELMLSRTLDAGVPVRWFAAGPGYGTAAALRQVCHRRSVAYILAMPAGQVSGRPAGEPPAPGYRHFVLRRPGSADGGSGRGVDHLVHAPAGTPVGLMLDKLRQARRAEDRGRLAAAAVGLAEFQARKWGPVYRHLTIAMLAIAALGV